MRELPLSELDADDDDDFLEDTTSGPPCLGALKLFRLLLDFAREELMSKASSDEKLLRFCREEKCVPDFECNVEGESGGVAGMDKINVSTC
jgi:hypothetical protein